MWLPMWVFDGNGFTMACLAVGVGRTALKVVCIKGAVGRDGDGIRRLSQQWQGSDYQPADLFLLLVGSFRGSSPNQLQPIESIKL
jgi:hypothetical protein